MAMFAAPRMGGWQGRVVSRAAPPETRACRGHSESRPARCARPTPSHYIERSMTPCDGEGDAEAGLRRSRSRSRRPGKAGAGAGAGRGRRAGPRAWRWLSEHLLLAATVAGVLAGVCTGLALRPLELGGDAALLLGYPGELVMRLLKLMILPLIIASLVSGAARLNASMNGKMAMRMLVYFVLTSLLNAGLGTALVLLMRPGGGGARLGAERLAPVGGARDVRILDSFLDLGRNVFTDNLFQAAFQQAHTVYVAQPQAAPAAPANAAPGNCSGPHADAPLVRALHYRDGTNTLGIIFFCLVFGTVLGHMGQKAHAVLEFFTTLDEAVMRIVAGVMWLTPIGIASVVCGKVLAVPDVAQVLQQLGWFILTVSIGVLIYQLFLMQLIYFIMVRRNPYTFYCKLAPATLTALATASTAAALPVTLRCMDREARIDPRVSRFVLPIGCSINMDGTALFVAVAAGFLAQLSGLELGAGDVMTLWLAATAASFSSASVPSAALVLIFMVMATLDAPQHDVPLLFTVDWLVDRVRTTNNMLGDCYAAAVVERLSQKELDAADTEAGPGAAPPLASLAGAAPPLLPVHGCPRCGAADGPDDDEGDDGDPAPAPRAVVTQQPPPAALSNGGPWRA